MTSQTANLTVTIYEYAMQPYKDLKELAWVASFLITISILGLNIFKRILFKGKKMIIDTAPKFIKQKDTVTLEFFEDERLEKAKPQNVVRIKNKNLNYFMVNTNHYSKIMLISMQVNLLPSSFLQDVENRI